MNRKEFLKTVGGGTLALSLAPNLVFASQKSILDKNYTNKYILEDTMKKLIALLSLVLTLGLVGCSSKSEVKDIPVSDIKSAILISKESSETILFAISHLTSSRDPF